MSIDATNGVLADADECVSHWVTVITVFWHVIAQTVLYGYTF